MEALDYIRSVNALCEDIHHSHGDLLRRKNIRRKQDLIQAIKLDLDKLTHALYEVRENRAPTVVNKFTGGHSAEAPDVLSHLSSDCIYHVGFEIHEPLDLVLYGLNHWIENSKKSLGVAMRVTDYLRFPASPAFQNRVGAYTEIMRIWLEVDGHDLMLELFDIQRPVDDMLSNAPKPVHRNFHGLFRRDGRTHGHGARLLELFAPDEIWHYALYVNHPSDVRDLHTAWQEFAAREPSYSVPYPEPVHNPHDRSFHTKVIRHAGHGATRKELEFVTHSDA